ncbi:MAG: 16S rRNA (uracil(1498)-N(3))-methyltransferase [Betaproteobacteria bacterium]|nr:16S rRNA (uracil(1498)-N(3))-methyltransferase [Betaproteobacteria bacterium]
MNATSRLSAPRFHVGPGLSVGAELALPPRAARHVAVLRLRPGDEVILFDGSGGEYACTLSRFVKGEARVLVAAKRDIERESALDITLAQGLSSADRMDYALQKATELGVGRIQPVATERSVVRLAEERAERKLLHWRNVVIAACEQCGRNRVPEVAATMTLAEFLSAEHGGDLALLLVPEAERRLRDLEPARRIVILIGPEGGFSKPERAAVERAGFTPVRLGPRVLRTETAPLAAISALQAMWGDG